MALAEICIKITKSGHLYRIKLEYNTFPMKLGNPCIWDFKLIDPHNFNGNALCSKFAMQQL